MEIEGPEYETAALMGSNCMIADIKAVALANDICNELGMDTISAGGTVGFAMECYEKGLLGEDFPIKLNWGNAEAQRELLQMMAFRKGVAGKLFADGTKVASQKSEKEVKICYQYLWDGTFGHQSFRFFNYGCCYGSC